MIAFVLPGSLLVASTDADMSNKMTIAVNRNLPTIKYSLECMPAVRVESVQLARLFLFIAKSPFVRAVPLSRQQQKDNHDDNAE
jgi:hypothetical protein